jgi:hypothetical protein
MKKISLYFLANVFPSIPSIGDQLNGDLTFLAWDIARPIFEHPRIYFLWGKNKTI